MSETIFIPVTCPTCLRTGALALSAAEVQQKLDQGEAITLRCGFDGETWNASARERGRLARLCRENSTVPPPKQYVLKVNPIDTGARSRQPGGTH